jgi:hypothetical protein
MECGEIAGLVERRIERDDAIEYVDLSRYVQDFASSIATKFQRIYIKCRQYFRLPGWSMPCLPMRPTKAFVLLFTRGLHLELKGTSVSVSCLSPGTTTTGFNDRARLSDRIKATAEKFTMDPEVVAKKAIDGMFAGKMEIIPGFTNWISAKFAEILPKTIPEKIAAGIYKTDK